jgi:Zn finger protein HypA/HybF involved in hydrogenase expression
MKTVSAVPLFEEVPVDSTVRPPLGAPASWARIVINRAQLQCECTGQCGGHKRDGRCPRRHLGRHANKTITLAVAPKPAHISRPLHEVVTLPDSALMAWCPACQSAVEKIACGPGK